jgi:DNA-binding CsgD family transcriptional regulator
MCADGEVALATERARRGAVVPPCLAGERHGLLTLFDHMPTCTAVCTLHGSLLHANRALHAVLLKVRDRGHFLSAVRGLAIRLNDVPSATTTWEGDFAATLRGARLGEGTPRECGVLAAVVIEPHSAELMLQQKIGELAQLTAREREVAALLASGLSTKAIAREIGVSWCTARNHVARTMNKLGVSSRAQVAALAVSGRLGTTFSPGSAPARASPGRAADPQVLQRPVATDPRTRAGSHFD